MTTALRVAAQAMLDMYIINVNSGDWGNWNPENDKEVIALRAALAEPEMAVGKWTFPPDAQQEIDDLKRKLAEAVEALKFEREKIIDAWESLKGGQQTPVREVEKWLIEVMAPAINDLRRARAIQGEQP